MNKERLNVHAMEWCIQLPFANMYCDFDRNKRKVWKVKKKNNCIAVECKSVGFYFFVIAEHKYDHDS